MRHLALFILLTILSFGNGYSQLNTNRILAIGQNALYFEDYVLSIQYFNQVIRVKPHLADPYFLRAVAKINLEDYQGSEDDCTLALERNPFMINAYECRGIARINQKKYTEAQEDFAQGLKFDPGNRRLMLYSGIAFMQEENYGKAIETLSSTIQKNPKFVDAYLNRGQAYLANKDTTASLADFEKALSLDKYRADCYAARGIVRYTRGEYKAALDDYNEAIRMKPDRPGYYINRGLIRYHLNDLKGTLNDYDNVIQLDPNNSMAYYNRGLLRNEIGDKNRALEDFDRVLEFNPDDYIALYNRALIETELGESNRAIADINKVLKEYPDFYPLYYCRAEAKEKKGDKKGAQLDYNQAMLMERDRWKQQGQHQEEKEKGKEKKTRTKSDKSIKNFNRLVIADKEDEERRISFKSETRGKVQNINFNIDIEPLFHLSYYIKDNEMKKTNYFVQEITEINAKRQLPKKIQIGNHDTQLSKEQIVEHFHAIEEKTMSIEKNSHYILYLSRAIDFEMIQDYQSAIEDYGKAIDANPSSWIAYFNRANIRHKKMEYEASLEDEIKSEKEKELSQSSSQLIYGLMLNDYDQVTTLAPRLPFGWYNKANILSEQKDFRNAMANYTKAIELDKDFAEAYFNRGLVHILVGESREGIADLSKAGELGIYSAYNIIKRYNKE
ncbi:MAG: tetratricopeptide repeat protein [Paludibacteraceae bacterium]|nr:tetratricopeptide repeat protein [Paludibacteraceae bacterium]